MLPFSVSSGLPNDCQTWWKESHSRALVYKHEMGFVRLNTRYGDTYCMHLIMAQKHCERQWWRKNTIIYINANIYSARGLWSKDKPWREIQSIELSIDLALVLMSLGHGLVDTQHSWEKWNTQQEHRYPQIIKAPTEPGGVLTRKSPNNKVTHFILIPFSPPQPFLHARLLGMKQWVKSSLEQQETCCDSMTAHAYRVANTHVLYTNCCLLPPPPQSCPWQYEQRTGQSLLWPSSLSLFDCDLYHTLDTLAKLTSVERAVCVCEQGCDSLKK